MVRTFIARALYAWILFFSAIATPTQACTTAVISGRATVDGRPLLWKNRDINTTKNEVAYFPDGKYAVLAQANAGSRKSIWMGVNSAGLCIENSLCKDLTGPDDVKGLGNGEFMLRALKTCATVDDVQQLLEATNVTGRSTNGSFGVIDARGGAVLFESSKTSYTKFDANDPQAAPQGIIVRSNFSCTGQKLECPPPPEKLGSLYSADRYLRAAAILFPESGKVDVHLLLRSCSRDMADADGRPYRGTVNGPAGGLPEFIPTKNTISRTTTVSWAVFQGVLPGENPLLTTMWLGLGDPKFSAAVPCWVATAGVASELQGEEGAPLCLAANSLRERYYLRETDGVRTSGLDEIWRTLWSLEDELVERTGKKLTEWRASGIEPKSMAAIHLSAAEQVLANLRGLLESQTVPAGATVAP